MLAMFKQETGWRIRESPGGRNPWIVVAQTVGRAFKA